MKFNFHDKFRKKDKTSVKKVMVMTEKPSSGSRVITPPPKPPSPTFVNEQVCFEAEVSGAKVHVQIDSGFTGSKRNYTDSEEKDTDSIEECNPSIAGASSNGDVLGDTMHSETTKRWKDLRRILYTKIEDMSSNCLDHPTLKSLFADNLGEAAMCAVEKNRFEMDEMIGHIERETSMADPMWWVCAHEEVYDYEGPIMTCSDMKSCYEARSDMKSCLEAPEDIPVEEQDIAVIAPLPRN